MVGVNSRQKNYTYHIMILNMFAFRVIDRSNISFEIHLTENETSWTRHYLVGYT